MSFYLSNSETGPTGSEPLEFLDDPDVLEPIGFEIPVTRGEPGPADAPEPDASDDRQRRGLLAAARVWFTGRRTR